MEPTIAVGTLILTKDTAAESVKIDEIVCFRSSDPSILGKMITHRVIDRSLSDSGQVQLTTKGDANLAADDYYVTDENLIGRVIWTSSDTNGLSNLIAFLTSPSGFVICILLPCMLISGFIMGNSIRKMKADIQKVVSELPVEKSEKANDPKQSEKNEKESTSENSDEFDEYEAMVQRIRAELIEELKKDNGDDSH